MSTFNELHHCTSNLHFWKETGHFFFFFFGYFFFFQTHNTSGVLPVPSDPHLCFHAIQSNLLILSIYIIKCMQIPLPLSRNFKCLIKMFDSISIVPFFFFFLELAQSMLQVSLVLEKALHLVWQGYLQHAIPAQKF